MDPVQIIFEVETAHGMYRDALYFPADQVPSDEEIELLKQQRVDNWLVVINTPPLPPETVEINGVTYEKFNVDGQTLLKPVEV